MMTHHESKKLLVSSLKSVYFCSKLEMTWVTYSLIIRIMAVAIIHFILGLTQALLVVTFTIALRT